MMENLIVKARLIGSNIGSDLRPKPKPMLTLTMRLHTLPVEGSGILYEGYYLEVKRKPVQHIRRIMSNNQFNRIKAVCDGVTIQVECWGLASDLEKAKELGFVQAEETES